ncbi:hypothetical protein [Nocardia acidivorans]|uniref:hypothetical protein n=1 Tax=Nocardia acidivorans TaxID=404580 RepID=UPI00082C74DA|nr:hypothetical protein [Nocardia acidivorans]
MDRNAFVEVMNEASGMLESGRATEALARLTAFDDALLSPPDPKDYGWVVSYTFRSAFAAGEFEQALRIAENGPARFPADIPPATLATMYSMAVEAATQLGRPDSAVTMADRCIDIRRSHGDHGEVLMAAMTACTLLGDIERHDLAGRYAQLLIAEGDGEHRAYGYYAVCAAIEHGVGGHLVDTLRAGRDWLQAHDNEFAREALQYLDSSPAVANSAPSGLPPTGADAFPSPGVAPGVAAFPSPGFSQGADGVSSDGLRSGVDAFPPPTGNPAGSDAFQAPPGNPAGPDAFQPSYGLPPNGVDAFSPPSADPFGGPQSGQPPFAQPPLGPDAFSQSLPGRGPSGQPSLAPGDIGPGSDGPGPVGQPPFGQESFGLPPTGSDPFGQPPEGADAFAQPPQGMDPFAQQPGQEPRPPLGPDTFAPPLPDPVLIELPPLGPPLGEVEQTELLSVSGNGIESTTGPKQPPADQLAGGETADALLEAQRPGIAAVAYRALIDDAIATGNPDPLIVGKSVLGMLMALIFDNRVGEAHSVWIDEQGPTYLGVWALENGQTSVHDAMAYNLVAAFLHSLSTGDPNAANHAVDTLMGRCVNWAFGTDPQVVPAMLNTWRRHLYEIHEGEPAPEYRWELGQAEQRWGGPLPESGLYWMRPYPWVVDWL